MNNIIVGLDIGTSNIKMLVATRKKNEEKLEVVSQVQEPSFGMRKGIVIDPDKVSRTIQILASRVRAESDCKVDSVYVNIGGSHIFSNSSRGKISVSRADRKISEEDVKRVLQDAQTFSLPSNKDILEVFPKEFIIDGEGGVKDPVGMQGFVLEAEIFSLAAFSPFKNNLTQAVLEANLQISDILPSPLASANSVLTPKQKELGVALLDMGAGTSQLAVFLEGNLIHLSVFPLGSANITNDIAIGLKTDIDTAEAIKIKSGSCAARSSGKKIAMKSVEKIEIEGEGTLVVSHKMLARIIEARVTEIFGEVQKQLKEISKNNLFPAGVVLTGGGSNLPGLVALAKKQLKLPCRIGKPMGFANLDDDPSFATVCGLVLRENDFGKGNFSQNKISSFAGGLGNKAKKIFKIFLP